MVIYVYISIVAERCLHTIARCTKLYKFAIYMRKAIYSHYKYIQRQWIIIIINRRSYFAGLEEKSPYYEYHLNVTTILARGYFAAIRRVCQRQTKLSVRLKLRREMCASKPRYRLYLLNQLYTVNGIKKPFLMIKNKFLLPIYKIHNFSSFFFLQQQQHNNLEFLWLSYLESIYNEISI